MYDVLYFSGDEVVWGGAGMQEAGERPSSSPSRRRFQAAGDSHRETTSELDACAQKAPCKAGSVKRESDNRRSQLADVDPREATLQPMTYDDRLTTPEACIRLWISVLLIDKERGDRLTKRECEILSTLGLEASWVQRMIDTAPSVGKVCRLGLI